MTEHRIEDEQAIFLAALERTTPQERIAFVENACEGNRKLLDRVNDLLKFHAESRGPLDFPPPGVEPTQDHPISEQAGARIGPYKLLQQIGEGGFGVVYMAEQLEPVRRKVALKIIKPGMDTKEVVARFEAERQALALMEHPNIARVFDGGATESGRPYFVMELVKGIPLTDFCDSNRLALPERLRLFACVCRAVQHAHHKGVIHRDLKPTNVMVTLHDGRPVPKVIDFGVSKAISQHLTEKTLFTAYGQMIGTPAYMSPEQAEMSGLDIDTRSDIYSLGVLLYELLTGSTPVTADELRSAGFAEVQRIIREVEPPKPSTRLSTLGEATARIAASRSVEPHKLGSMVSGDLDWIVMRALDKDRERRYESANGLAEDIERFLNREPVEACPPSLGYRLRSYFRRNKQFLVIVGMIQALLLVGICVSAVLTLRMIEQRDRANSAEQLAGRRLENIRAEQVRTRDALEEARTARRIADARRLAARSRETAKDHRIRSLLLAVEAVQINRLAGEPHVPVAEQALRAALASVGRSPLVLRGQRAIGSSPDGRWLVTSSPDDIQARNGRETRLWNLKAKNPSEKSLALAGHSRGVLALAFSPDARWLVTAGWGRKAFLWNLSEDDPSQAPVTLLTGAETKVDLRFPPVLGCQFSGNGRWLMIAGPDFETRIWDMAGKVGPTPTLMIPAEDKSRAVDFRVSPDNRWLVTLGMEEATTSVARREAHLRLWGLSEDQPRDIHLGGHIGGVAFYEFSGDGRWLITGGQTTKAVRVWDLTRRNPAERSVILEGHEHDISHWAISPDRRWLATSSKEGSPRIWALSAGSSPRLAFVAPGGNEQPSEVIGFSPDSRWFAIRENGSKSVSLWDLTSRTPLGDQQPRRIDCPFVGRTGFSPDGRWLSCVNFDEGRVHVTDLTQVASSGIELPRPIGDVAITSVRFSPDGHWLATFCEGNQTRLWNLSTPSPAVMPVVLTGLLSRIAEGADSRHNYGIYNLPFSGDGRWFITRYRTPDGGPNTALWALRIDELIELARTAAGRTLSQEERRQYSIPALSPGPGGHRR